MHRVELKGTLVGKMPLYHEYFLMHRVELEGKGGAGRGYLIFFKFLMHRVELEAHKLQAAPKQLGGVPNAPCGVGRLKGTSVPSKTLRTCS
jgi:hypothetical protein